MAKSRGKRKRKKKTSGLYLSTMVIHRITDTMDLVSSIKVYREKLSARLAERYAPGLRPGEEVPDYALVLDLAVRDVRAAVQRLSDLDDEVAFARTDQVCRVEERARLVREQLYPRAVAVRSEIDLAFGRPQASWFHGMKGRTRRTGPSLEVQLRLAVRRLANLERPLPAPKNRYAVVDRDRWLRQLQPPYQELVALNRKIAAAKPVIVGLTLDKNAAMAAFDLSYRDALNLATATFTAAGLTGTPIKHIKPYYQRRRLSAQARKKRQARAAAAVPDQAATQAAPPAKDSDRVAVPIPMAEWLENNRRLVSG